MDLFGSAELRPPLAERMRPRTLDEFVGQAHVLAPGKALREAIERGAPGSLILWGPPGVGKTTLARLIAAHLTGRARRPAGERTHPVGCGQTTR